MILWLALACTEDADSDGFDRLADCDDHEAAVHPSAAERPYNGIDDDCDPSTPDDDADGDGVATDEDCDDSDPEHWSAATWSGADILVVGAEGEGDFCAPHDCLTVQGWLLLQSWTAEDALTLSCVYEVEGELLVDAGDATSLAGLEHIRAVGDRVLISRNGNLETLEGLGGLQTLGGSLGVQFNPALRSLDGVGDIESARDIRIWDNDELETAFLPASLTQVTGYVEFADNSRLSEVRLPGVSVILGDLIVRENPNLADLTGLRGITTVGGDLTLSGGLASLDGLADLTSVGGALLIDGNSALTDLAGLESLRVVSGDLAITDNRDLTDVTALYGLGRVDGAVSVVDNRTLTDAAAADLVANIESIGGEVTISGNGP